jgi:hypothetical protein
MLVAFNQRMSKQRAAAPREQRTDPAFRAGRPLHPPRVGQYATLRSGSVVAEDKISTLMTPDDELLSDDEAIDIAPIS